MSSAIVQERPASAEVELPAGPRLDKVRTAWASGPLMLPAAILLAMFFIGPVVFSIYLGFTNLQLVGPTSRYYEFTGLDNVTRLLSDGVFTESVWLTLIFVVGSAVFGATLVGLTLALAMQSSLALIRAIVGAIALVAFMLPAVVVSVCWLASSTQGGVYPVLTGDATRDFIHNYPMTVMCVANAWNLSGMAMILFAAALRNIPADIHEAARMENASALQRLVKITLPLLAPTIVTTVLLMTLLSLANFTIIFLMTGGGPGTATMIMPLYSYVQGFNYNNLGYGALIGNVMVLFTAVLSFFYLRLARQK